MVQEQAESDLNHMALPFPCLYRKRKTKEQPLEQEIVQKKERI